MTQIITRFAPSPTGMLHVGNARTAIINWLYAKKYDGLCYLRLDDTDLLRCKAEYKTAIKNDLDWLGLYFDKVFVQSARFDLYNQAKEHLLKIGRLYPCFETPEELEIKRKLQLAVGKPPIYDRAALQLSKQQVDDLIAQGKTPHYRFLIEDTSISWYDLIKDDVHYEGQYLTDPILIRADGSMTYMLCSVVDDIDYCITHIIRGEDHIANTAIQIQLFEALKAKPPQFGHLSLVKVKEGKISKRLGGFDLTYLRDQFGIEPMSINSFFALIGSSRQVVYNKNIQNLIDSFDVHDFSKSPTTYMYEELEQLNHKLLIHLNFDEVKDRLGQIGLKDIDADFWYAVRSNLRVLPEIKDWWDICYNFKYNHNMVEADSEFLYIASKLLPNIHITENIYHSWIKDIMKITDRRGKQLFQPLRIGITGMDYGPELKNILPLIGSSEVIKRLQNSHLTSDE